MMKIKTYILIYTLIFFIQNSSFSQEFKILDKNNSFILVEFKLDTNLLKTIAFNKDSIDFRDYFYCSNKYKNPNLPIFNCVFGIEDSSLNFITQKLNSIHIPIKSIKKNNYIKKRNGFVYAKLNEYNDFIRLSDPYENRSFKGQSLIIQPISYDSIKSTIDCIYSITLKIYKSKRFISRNENITDISNPQINKIFYDFKKRNTRKIKDLSKYTSEMLIIFQDSNKMNGELIANWKNQKGLKTNLINLKGETDAIKIKNFIVNHYNSNPNLEYVLILGNQNEIPAYLYGFIDGDNNYSDSYYGQISNDLYPEIYVGRITGNSTEIKNSITKSIFYEKENFEGNWMTNSIGIASNEGLNEGDNKEADWQHLRIIKSKLHTFGYKKVHEFYDSDHGGEDENGDPNKTKIINAINEGASIINYTGHGDNNLMLTGQFTSSDVLNLKNQNKNPFIISVACNNGKFINNTGSIAETFLKCPNDSIFNGAIGFCGSTILMDWAPPMFTQDEIVNSIITIDSNRNQLSMGELFYSSQTKMLDKYGNLGDGVMQTWILFGDPSLDLKTKIPQALEFSYEVNINENKLIILSENNNTLLGISSNNKLVGSYFLKKGFNTIMLDSLSDQFLLTFTKPNYITKQISLKTNKTNYLSDNKQIKIYPNPMSDLNQTLTIHSNKKIISITISDLTGKVIDQINSENQSLFKFTLPNHLSKGIYLINIIDSNQHSITTKIEVQ